MLELDTLLGGWERVTAGYLIEGDAPGAGGDGQPELGARRCWPTLDRLGLGPDDLAGVVVTHIHLDHAGGVGDVARAFPKATVYVHPKGARHLADPTRLVDSAARVYGPLLDSLYGRLDPTPAERIHVLEDGEEIRVGANRVADRRRLARPRQAPPGPPRQLERDALRRRRRGGASCPTPGCCGPSTPPPDFDLDQALTSLRRFAERRPTGLALAHYGLLADPLDVLDEADGTLRRVGRRGRVGLPGRAGHRRRAVGEPSPPTSTGCPRSTARSSRS